MPVQSATVGKCKELHWLTGNLAMLALQLPLPSIQQRFGCICNHEFGHTLIGWMGIQAVLSP